eukprot:15434089-Alexandrium_andersonii.AAC.1
MPRSQAAGAIPSAATHPGQRRPATNRGASSQKAGSGHAPQAKRNRAETQSPSRDASLAQFRLSLSSHPCLGSASRP